MRLLPSVSSTILLVEISFDKASMSALIPAGVTGLIVAQQMRDNKTNMQIGLILLMRGYAFHGFPSGVRGTSQ